MFNNILKLIKGIFQNLFKIKDKNCYSPLHNEIEYEKNPLPPWEEIIEMCYDKQLDCYGDEVVKVIYSKPKDFRAIILKASTGIYTVSYEKLYPWDSDNEYEMFEYWSGGLPGCWEPFCDGSFATSSFYDTLKTAEKEVFSMPQFQE